MWRRVIALAICGGMLIIAAYVAFRVVLFRSIHGHPEPAASSQRVLCLNHRGAPILSRSFPAGVATGNPARG